MSSKSQPVSRRILSGLIVAVSLGLGLAFNSFFYGHIPGLAFPVFVALIISGLFALSSYINAPISRSAAWLVLPLMFFSGMLAVRASPSLGFINVVASLALLLLIADIALGGRLNHFAVGDYFRAMISPLNFFGPLRGTIADLTAAVSVGRDQKYTHQIVRGLIITIPVLIVFLLLLSSADLIFQKYVTNLVALNISDEDVARAILVALVALGFTGAYAYAFSRPNHPTGLEQTPPVARLGRIESTMLLGSVGALFFVFIVIQLAYLFGGQLNISAQGFTYAEYARKGFFELIFVAVLSFLLLWVTERQTVKGGPTGHSLQFKILAGVLIAELLVIMASAFKRLWLYEQAYGFTTQRLFSHAFIFLLAAIFILLFIKIVRDSREHVFAFQVFIAAIAFVAALNVLNPDAFIARQNLQRFADTGKLDTAYLSQLSADAVPAMLAALPLSDPVQSASLANYLYYMPNRQSTAPHLQGWQSWNLSRYRAQSLLEDKMSQLETYKGYQAQPEFK